MSSNFLNDNLFSVYANSNKIFIETESQKYSFKEFDDLINKISNLLITSGLNKGDRVLVKLEKSIFSFALYISTIRAGGIFIPVNTKHRLANNSQLPLVVIEVWYGDILNENDIIRYDDIYNRS